MVSQIGGGRSAARSSASTFEWAPQPWSTLTTVPSETEKALVQAPNIVPRLPCRRTKNPQVSQMSGASLLSGLSGPPSPASHRSACLVSALCREHALSTQAKLATTDGSNSTRRFEVVASSPPV